MDRELITEQLQNGLVFIRFEKADGTLRDMYATLASDIIGEEPSEKETTRKVNPEVRPVFDAQLREWRSFRWDSIRHAEPILTRSPPPLSD